MFVPLTYRADKEYLRKYFWKNYMKGEWHEFNNPRLIWWKLYVGHPKGTIINDNTNVEIVYPIIEELGILGLHISPRFSYQFANTRLEPHFDIDDIVGININLMEDNKCIIHLEGKPHQYECALIDVGGTEHSVEPMNFDRLILKLAIREPWEKIYNRLDDAGWI